MKQRNYGFTLIETLLALSILIIFVGVIAYSYSVYKRNIRALDLYSNITRISSTIKTLSEGTLKPNVNVNAVSSSRTFPKSINYSVGSETGTDSNGNTYSFNLIDDAIRAFFPQLISDYSAYHITLVLLERDLCYSLLQNAVPGFDLIASNLGVVKDNSGVITIDNRCADITTIYFINY